MDKPPGPTSFRIVSVMKRLAGIKRVGHAGTLDPFASGLLVVCVGRPATRLVPSLMTGIKEYEAVIWLGIATDTMDTEGRVIRESPVVAMGMRQITETLQQFIGRREQKPPCFSAVKHQGRPLYTYARQGVMVDKEPRTITIFAIRPLFASFTSQAAPENLLGFKVRCSKGTYVRVLAEEIGNALGCGGHLKSLRRTGSGPFHVKHAVPAGLLTRRQGQLLLHKKRLSVEEVQEQEKQQLHVCPSPPPHCGFL